MQDLNSAMACCGIKKSEKRSRKDQAGLPSSKERKSRRKRKSKKRIETPEAKAAEILRLSIDSNSSVNIDEHDGTIKGWLWKQQENCQWLRLYFVLNGTSLKAFKRYPKRKSVPVVDVTLQPRLVVTPALSSNFSICGHCFAIQTVLNSPETIVLDALSNNDRALWVEALQTATKAEDINNWAPWTVSEKERDLQLQQERKMMKEMQLKEAKRIMQERLEREQQRIRCSATSLITDATIIETLENSLELEKRQTSLIDSIDLLQKETDELKTYKHQIDETPGDLNTSREIINSKIAENEKVLQEWELQIQKAKEEYERITAESKEQLARIKEEEKKMEVEVRAHVEREIEKRMEEVKREQEEKYQKILEKKRQEEISMITNWLKEHPVWTEYYKSIDLNVDSTEPTNVYIMKEIIKFTWEYAEKVGFHDPEEAVVLIETKIEEQEIPPPPSIPSSSIICPPVILPTNQNVSAGGTGSFLQDIGNVVLRKADGSVKTEKRDTMADAFRRAMAQRRDFLTCSVQIEDLSDSW